jgi:glycosyltransferase involved in cell wall biosynthesis
MMERSNSIEEYPLVSVICISYNHAPYIKEALKSVFDQSYKNLEIIILDDASKDESQTVIKGVIQGKDNIQVHLNQTNQGYTKTFNQGLTLAKGEFVVDFSLDDILHSDFLAKSIAKLQALDVSYGVSFSNAEYINNQSLVIDNHNALLRKKGLIDVIPEGNIFEMVLKRYFICTPTMVIRKIVFDRMGGYDEDLAFEDFDFWVRSSRYFKYTYIDEVLVRKRKLKNSMSANRYRHRQNAQMASIFKVCEKAFGLCKSKGDLNALKVRLYYEHRQCIRNEAYELAHQYLGLLKLVKGNTLKANMIGRLIKFGFDFSRN